VYLAEMQTEKVYLIDISNLNVTAVDDTLSVFRTAKDFKSA
jgi:hypothetical protein